MRRPLDFTAVTDHAEFLGALNICTTDPSRLGYWAPHCILTRSQNFYAQLLAVGWWSTLKGEDTETPFVCQLSDCASAALSAWTLVQEAAERHYDRSSNCAFTTFVGYEYSNAPDFRNLHRNVIFRNEKVTPAPISTYDTGLGPDNVPRLWEMLGKQCLDAGTGCDVLAIPHNPNLSGGLMFLDPASPKRRAIGCATSRWWSSHSTRAVRSVASIVWPAWVPAPLTNCATSNSWPPTT